MEDNRDFVCDCYVCENGHRDETKGMRPSKSVLLSVLPIVGCLTVSFLIYVLF